MAGAQGTAVEVSAIIQTGFGQGKLKPISDF
jgi:hypothetical protein